MSHTTQTGTSTDVHPIALYRNHCVVYADGSPAYVPVGQSPNTIPTPYVEFAKEYYKNDPLAAEKHWKASQEWRSTLWDILHRPPTLLREMERVQPMYFHGISKEGHIVMYEPMREADLEGMFQNGLTVESHVERAIYLFEFAQHELCRGTGRYVPPAAGAADADNYDDDDGDNATTNAIMPPPPQQFSSIYVKDLLDLDMGKYFGGPAFQCRMNFFDLARAHYPGSLAYAFCLNLPRWMAIPARSFLKAILWGFRPPELLFHKNQQIERMMQVIDPDQIPVQYGGTSPYQLGEHPLHLRYLAFTEYYLQQQQKQQQQKQSEQQPQNHNVPTTIATTSTMAIGSSSSSFDKVLVGKESTSQASSSTSTESTPTELSTTSSSTISLSEHNDCVQECAPQVVRPQQPQQQQESSNPIPSTSVEKVTDTILALVTTMWLGIWSFWSAIHSLVVVVPGKRHSNNSTDETTIPTVVSTLACSDTTSSSSSSIANTAGNVTMAANMTTTVLPTTTIVPESPTESLESSVTTAELEIAKNRKNRFFSLLVRGGGGGRRLSNNSKKSIKKIPPAKSKARSIRKIFHRSTS